MEMIISRAKLTNFICEICVAGNFSHACNMRKSISHVKSTNYSWFNFLFFYLVIYFNASMSFYLASCPG